VERIIYDRMEVLDGVHWWYLARRDILATLIAREIALKADAKILEIGCGTGHNLEMLARFGSVDGSEVDPAARTLAATRLGKTISDARLPELKGIPNSNYDLIALLDVLEHVEDDRAALISIGERLRPGGHLLITVPAHQWMWSAHDVTNHHFRRYAKLGLRDVLQSSGFKIELLSSFNSLLFPLAVAARAVGRITGREGSDDALPPAPINALCKTIFGLEAYLVGRVPMPPGLSLVAIATLA
jgi:SAM-dependent methyltransferase